MPHRGRKNADEVLLLALACGATAESAATKAGVSEATVYRRLQDADFNRRLRKTRADMVQRWSGMLTAAAGEAVKTLVALQKETTPASARLGAVRAILEIGMKLRKVGELEERIAALEESLDPGQRNAS